MASPMAALREDWDHTEGDGWPHSGGQTRQQSPRSAPPVVQFKWAELQSSSYGFQGVWFPPTHALCRHPKNRGSWEKAGDSGARWLLLLPLQGNVWCCVIQHTQPHCSHIKLREKCLVSLIASCYYAELIYCDNPAHAQDNILRLRWKGFPPKNRLIHITTVFLNAPFGKTRFLDCCHYCFCNFHGYYIYFISQITEPMSEWYPLTLFFWRSYSFCLFQKIHLASDLAWDDHTHVHTMATSGLRIVDNNVVFYK